jgi:hypothetical protein
MGIAEKTKLLEEMVDSPFVKTISLMDFDDIAEVFQSEEEFRTELITMESMFHELLWQHGTYDVMVLSNFNQTRSDKSKRLELVSEEPAKAFTDKHMRVMKDNKVLATRWRLFYHTSNSKTLVMDRTVAIIKKGK